MSNSQNGYMDEDEVRFQVLKKDPQFRIVGDGRTMIPQFQQIESILSGTMIWSHARLMQKQNTEFVINQIMAYAGSGLCCKTFFSWGWSLKEKGLLFLMISKFGFFAYPLEKVYSSIVGDRLA